MNVPTGLLVAAYKFVSQHKDDIIDYAKDAIVAAFDAITGG